MTPGHPLPLVQSPNKVDPGPSTRYIGRWRWTLTHFWYLRGRDRWTDYPGRGRTSGGPSLNVYDRRPSVVFPFPSRVPDTRHRRKTPFETEEGTQCLVLKVGVERDEFRRPTSDPLFLTTKDSLRNTSLVVHSLGDSVCVFRLRKTKWKM